MTVFVLPEVVRLISAGALIWSGVSANGKAVFLATHFAQSKADVPAGVDPELIFPSNSTAGPGVVYFSELSADNHCNITNLQCTSGEHSNAQSLADFVRLLTTMTLAISYIVKCIVASRRLRRQLYMPFHHVFVLLILEVRAARAAAL
jgi:hypothetical protein